MSVPLIGADKKPLTKEESAKVIEAAIRKDIKKPTGELTKADLEKVKEMASKWEKWPELARVKPWPWKVD
ncbi:uncharacterized protein METZ01_LOCUS321979 [marine metagenome]|uniref:Uncharacterized protein n=1 Tax=marine metagenome TaxID=408172 RepID=A0A382P939_9ZZZZ